MPTQSTLPKGSAPERPNGQMRGNRISPAMNNLSRTSAYGPRTFAARALSRPASAAAPPSPEPPSEEPRYEFFIGPRIDKPFFLAIGLGAYFLFHDRARQKRGEEAFTDRLERQWDRWHRKGLEIQLPYVGFVRVITGTDSAEAVKEPVAVQEPVVVIQPPLEPEPKIIADIQVDPNEIDAILRTLSEAVQDPQEHRRN